MIQENNGLQKPPFKCFKITISQVTIEPIDINLSFLPTGTLDIIDGAKHLCLLPRFKVYFPAYKLIPIQIVNRI